MNTSSKIICPLCREKVDHVLYFFHMEDERRMIGKIREQHPDWSVDDGACSRCLDYYRIILDEQRSDPSLGPFFQLKTVDDFVVLPIPLRVNADSRYRGRGVTICFIDAGFYQHADLIGTRNRIRKTVNMANNETGDDHETINRNEHAVHGTMTSVVCAGDGYLSKGLYRGIASESELVFLQVMDEKKRITTGYITRALEWIEKNHRLFNVRIVNISVYGDGTDEDRLALEKILRNLASLDIIVVAAIGNEENGSIRPPADSRYVISVGGTNDHNSINGVVSLYHSAYGTVTEGLPKPELVAPAIWVAAPLLPGSRAAAEAKILFQLLELPDEEILQCLPGLIGDIDIDRELLSATVGTIRNAILKRIGEAKYISEYYVHVDGTSFAAPVVTGVIAQLLEADPSLTSTGIREILFDSAKRLTGFPALRQGYGLIQPRKAVLKLLHKGTMENTRQSPFIDRQRKTVRFCFHSYCAESVSVSGSFNNWIPEQLPLEPERHGWWKIEIQMPAAGRYPYKFLINGDHWTEDTRNPCRETDGFDGFNSVLVIDDQNN